MGKDLKRVVDGKIMMDGQNYPLSSTNKTPKPSIKSTSLITASKTSPLTYSQFLPNPLSFPPQTPYFSVTNLYHYLNFNLLLLPTFPLLPPSLYITISAFSFPATTTVSLLFTTTTLVPPPYYHLHNIVKPSHHTASGPLCSTWMSSLRST